MSASSYSEGVRRCRMFMIRTILPWASLSLIDVSRVSIGSMSLPLFGHLRRRRRLRTSLDEHMRAISYVMLPKNSSSECGSQLSQLPRRASISSGCMFMKLAMPELISSCLRDIVRGSTSIIQYPALGSFEIVSFRVSMSKGPGTPATSDLLIAANSAYFPLRTIFSMACSPRLKAVRTEEGMPMNMEVSMFALYPACQMPLSTRGES
mmetsp:Transcript_16880/g.38445  ORF Transcript_16880/g.38445 Transcript_16880/m.38445 type:complete len:208 (-) Transcript_16880:626-1249(-)